MQEINNGMHQLKHQIAIEINRLKRTMKADLERAEAIENSMIASLKKQTQVSLSLTEKSIQYEVLKQQADSVREIYNFL